MVADTSPGALEYDMQANDGEEAGDGPAVDQALEAVRVEVHLEMELGARPVRPPLVREQGRPLVLLVVIAPVGRGMGHGGLDVVVLVKPLGATTSESVVIGLAHSARQLCA